MIKANITAWGIYAPEKKLTNNDLETLIETNDEWIRQRTGIKERRVVGENERNSDLCIKATSDLLERTPMKIEDVDFIIVATSTPDHIMPSTASRVQAHFNIKQAGAIDVSAACAGFAYAVQLAYGLVSGGINRKVLVIGSETLTDVVNYEDRTTCILFGDGAGACIVEAEAKGAKIINTISGTQGPDGYNLYLTKKHNHIDGHEITPDSFLHQDGRKVFKWAVGTVSEKAKELIKKSGLEVEDIDWFVPHSANQRIIEAIAQKIGLPVEKALSSVEYYGNTSTASIPLAFVTDGLDKNKIKKGDKILMIGFGGGLTYAGYIIEW